MMKTKNNKAKAAVAVLVFLGASGILFLAFASNWNHNSGIFGTTASAQLINVGVPGQGAAAIYVRFDGVDGESQDRDHRGWIDVQSFSQGQFVPNSSPAGTGNSRSASSFEDIILKKALDKSSPKLAEAVCLGKVFPNVDIHLTRISSDGTQIPYFIYELRNALVTSYRIESSTNDIPIEEVSLNFAQIKVTYTQADTSDKSGGNTEYSWDIIRNQPQ